MATHLSNLDRTAAALVACLGGKWRCDIAMCRCPAHDDRTPSLKIEIGERAILYYCYAGCSQEAVGNAIRALGERPLSGYEGHHSKPRKSTNLRWLAEKIWHESVPLKGSLGEIYYRSRKIDFIPPETRFNPACIYGSEAERSVHPGIISRISERHKFVAIQRTLLSADGLAKADVDEPKTTLGFPAGGLGRWGPEPSHTMRLAEGNEDAASAMIIATGGIPVWPVYGIRRYGTIDIADTIKHIIIYTQPGKEAASAIAAATPHLTANNRTLEVIPPFGDGDWNNLLQAIRR